MPISRSFSPAAEKIFTWWSYRPGQFERNRGLRIDLALCTPDLAARVEHVVRRVVGRGLQLRFTPEIKFQIDETFDRLDTTRAMFADENVRRDLDND